MKNLPVIIAVGAFFLLAWAFLTGRLSAFMPASKTGYTNGDTKLTVENDSSIKGATTSPGNVTTNVTTSQEKTTEAQTITKFTPTRNGAVLRDTVGVLNGVNIPLSINQLLAVYGTDSKGHYSTSKGLVPTVDVKLFVATNSSRNDIGATTNSNFNLKIRTQSSIQ